MRRCPVCRADSKLIHFGIYLCPTCGTTDADGRPVAPPPGALLTPASPAVYETLSLAAPTPVADDTQPNPIAIPPVMPAPRPVPLELAPPRPTPAPPAPLPLAAAPPHPRLSSPDPLTVVPGEISRTSFAPPPPRDPRELVQSNSGPPQMLVMMLGAYFLFELGQLALSQLPGCCVAPWMLLRLGFLMALFSGRVWARTSSMFFSVLGIVGSLLVMVQPMPLGVRGYFGVAILFEVAWLYVLTRPEVVKYFTK